MQNRCTSDIQCDWRMQRHKALWELCSLMRGVKTPKGFGLTPTEGIAGGESKPFDQSAPLSSSLHPSQPFCPFQSLFLSVSSAFLHLFSLTCSPHGLMRHTLKLCRQAWTLNSLSDKDRLPPIGNERSLVANSKCKGGIFQTNLKSRASVNVCVFVCMDVGQSRFALGYLLLLFHFVI